MRAPLVVKTTRFPEPRSRACAWRQLLACLCTVLLSHQLVPAQKSSNIKVTIDVSQAVNRFAPAYALGAGIDGHDKGVIDLQLTMPNIQDMLTAGFKSLTYRLRTELAGDVWHWNPRGVWSDVNQRQGYWISDSKLGEPISLSYGYRLPRRGDTIDQADNEGYSRIDDGDLQSFWKSNPYLDRHFTGEDYHVHPQWIVIEFAHPEPINALRLVWGVPFARRYRIQYGNFDDVSDIALNPPGTWRDFPSGFVGRGKGGEVSLRLAGTPIKARWLRILLLESSQTGAEGSTDIRDRLGFAVREVSAGILDQAGTFHDRVEHAPDRHRQTIFHVSSTDPWHRDSDLDQNVEQAGLDRVYRNGLTNDLPMLLPVGLMYDTPENAANEVGYLRARGYKFDRLELGEEPDGQYIPPEDFGALYLQWANAIHRVDPKVQLGGPSFQEILPDTEERDYKLGNSEWLRRFLKYLSNRGRASDYSFFSFEWYPFDEVCVPVAPQLARAPVMLANALGEMQRRGLSRSIPWIISEYGYSAFATRAELTLEGAILNADIVGKFLSLGGKQAFLFGYTPGYSNRDFPCTAGNNMLFSMGDDGGVEHRFATYFGARLLNNEWLEPGVGIHELFSASSDARNTSGEELVTTYAVHRPDGLWSLLLLNKDPQRAFEADIVFHNGLASSSDSLQGQLDLYQYSEAQYLLGGSPDDPAPIRAEDPAHQTIESNGQRTQITLPPYSMTVIRGRRKLA